MTQLATLMALPLLGAFRPSMSHLSAVETGHLVTLCTLMTQLAASVALPYHRLRTLRPYMTFPSTIVTLDSPAFGSPVCLFGTVDG
ncbi:hypothetical protein BDZ89DRAFT_1056484 [Hymenopellis radicata]|nr:hypothetical protein BDZ89DRAFT_1056484 [Hymenopellis radicata]